jgi:tRNA threonylcarbamoyladenosine biosynthesis protein TsaB
LKTLLHIETATDVCSVALSSGGKVIAEQSSSEKLSHASELMPLINRLLDNIGIQPSDLDAVSVSSGPGSYTGLRIGVSTAKGIAYALNIPLIAVGSLQSAAAGILDLSNPSDDDLIIPMIDARRMEVFMAVYNRQLKELKASSPLIVDESSFEEWLPGRIIFGGSGAAKLKTMFGANPNVVFVDGNIHNAAYAAKLAFARFEAGEFDNTAYFEPVYGKEFVAGAPKVKGLR